jgi:hypothetical protein
MTWSQGDTIVVRVIARSDGSVASATPAIVIRDDETVLAVFVPPGTVSKDNYVVPDGERASAARNIGPSRERQHQDRTWQVPTVRLYTPGEAFSVWLFFNPAGDFVSWYGNLESPFLRTELGIDTRDHALDVVADVDGHWSWKDEAEFAARLAAGIDTPEHQLNVRAAGQAFITRLVKRNFPFDTGWERWRAPPDWLPRPLPADWNADFGSDAHLR